MRLTPSRNLILVLAGALVLTIVALIGSIVYGSESVARGQRTLQAAEKELKDKRQIAARAEEAVSQLDADLARVAHLKSLGADSEYVPTLLKDLNVLARETRNTVESITPDIVLVQPRKIDERRDPEAKAKEQKDAKKSEPEDPYVPQAVRVALRGTYQSGEAFVQRLREFPKIVSVEEVTMRPVTDAHDGETLQIGIKIVAYMMKDKVDLTQPAQTASAAAGGTP